MAVSSVTTRFDWTPPNFTLLGVDGETWSLDQVKGPKGTVIMFICNHCPYVLAVLDRMVRDAKDLQAMGIGVAAICSNDALAYPNDSFEKMGDLAQAYGFSFLYLHDADQSIARAFDAVCTPEFFGFNADLGLQYRGRLDAVRTGPVSTDMRRDLVEAMREIAETGQGPEEQIASMGCSIKWKAA